MKIGDIVVVASQPSNQCANLVGERAHIEEIGGDYAQIEAFSISGRAKGVGSVPLKCLVPESAARWINAKSILDAERANFHDKIIARQQLWRDKLKEVAKRHRVSAKKVYEIYKELDTWKDQV